MAAPHEIPRRCGGLPGAVFEGEMTLRLLYLSFALAKIARLLLSARARGGAVNIYAVFGVCGVLFGACAAAERAQVGR